MIDGNVQPTTETRKPDAQPGANAIQMMVLLQFVILVGLGIGLLQLNGLPDQTAQRVPNFSSGISGEVYSATYPIASGVTDLETKVDALTVKIDTICAALTKSAPAASPNPCAAP